MSDVRKLDLQFLADVENEDRAEGGKNQAGRVEFRVGRSPKQVGHGAPDDRSDDAENDRPENRHVFMHDPFRGRSRDESNENVPNQVKHNFAFG
jgi:hypothetical protein